MEEVTDEYMWLLNEDSCKNITYKRKTLDNMARKKGLNPDEYSNRKKLLQAIIRAWEDKFRADPEYLRRLKEECGIDLIDKFS